MTRCSWAACAEPAAHNDGQYDHCPKHWEQHLAFAEEDEMRERMTNRVPAGPKARSRQRVRDVQTCVALGMDTNEIAGHLGIDASYVRSLRREGNVPAPVKQAQCGTRAGYERHRTRREDPCEPCTEARREYDRQRYGRRKKQAA